jgi:hypothetical protein
MPNDKIQTEDFDNKLIPKLILCAGLSAFGVIFMWGFWSQGVYALGVNAFLLGLLTYALFIGTLYKKGRLLKSDLIWIIPLGLILSSFLIYDNPFLKVTSILVLIAMFALFFNYAFLDDKKSRPWNFVFFVRILNRVLSFLGQIGKSATWYLELIIPASKAKKKIIAKVIFGIILFLIIALTVFIPLLSAADAVFAGKMQAVYSGVKEIFSLPVIYKIITFVISSILLFAILFSWGRRLNYEETEDDSKKIDPIIPGIVIGGILIIYLLFLWIQLERLWVGTLPFDFKETENLVKSGFWQLLSLSIINIIIYFFTYKKTNPLVQWILTIFTVASFLLLSSAGYRMGLYVRYYGFSYEKFFASYTVLYCAILFIWLIVRLGRKKRSNIVKFLIVLFFWMYAVVAVLPVERFILRANISLSGRAESRIRLFELSMLSPDVLPLVKHYTSTGLLKAGEKQPLLEGETMTDARFSWKSWIEEKEKILADKKWYESNLMNIIYRIK